MIKCNAKINLTLDIVGKRPDGWHEIRSVMHPIPLYDIINIEQKNEGITLKCNKPYIPTDHRNLIYKAAKLFFDETGIKKGVNITLEKYIPVGAGLGGGSSNAAATLLALNSIFKTGISTQKLSELGAKIGADVPFFIANQTQLAEGIGEKLTILPPLPCCYLVLVIPAFSIRTKLAYSQVAGLNMPCTTNKMIEALKKGDLKDVAKNLGNHLESAVISHYPDIEKYKKILIENGALNAIMTGSGSAVYGLFENNKGLDSIKNLFKNCKCLVMSI